jgi:hypothetical protein
MKNILLFLILSSSVFSQKTNRRDISIQDSFNWIAKFEEVKSESKKLDLIIEKVKQDSVIDYNPVSTYISKNGHIHDSINLSKPCKILFVLNQRKNMWLIDLNQFPKYSGILKFITIDKIEKINILNKNAGRTVFGYRGECGVIMIKSNNRKLKRLFKKASSTKKKVA